MNKPDPHTPGSDDGFIARPEILECNLCFERYDGLCPEHMPQPPKYEGQFMCDQYPECGLTSWSCNELQNLVYEDDTNKRRETARAIRKDMAEFLQAQAKQQTAAVLAARLDELNEFVLACELDDLAMPVGQYIKNRKAALKAESDKENK